MTSLNFKKKILFVFVVLFLIQLVSSADNKIEFTFQQSESGDICHPSRLDGEISPNINCNITIYYPNGTTLVDFQEMRDEGDRFCYTLNSNETSLKGEYDYEVTCYTDNKGATNDYTYLVNLGGIQPTQQRTDSQNRTILIFFGLALLFFISMFFVKSFPIKLTMFLLMSWFILMGINFTYIAIGDEVLNPSLENFFSFFLRISFYANYFIFITIGILWLITLIYNTINVQNRRKRSKYGFEGIQY